MKKELEELREENKALREGLSKLDLKGAHALIVKGARVASIIGKVSFPPDTPNIPIIVIDHDDDIQILRTEKFHLQVKK